MSSEDVTGATKLNEAQLVQTPIPSANEQTELINIPSVANQSSLVTVNQSDIQSNQSCIVIPNQSDNGITNSYQSDMIRIERGEIILTSDHVSPKEVEPVSLENYYQFEKAKHSGVNHVEMHADSADNRIGETLEQTVNKQPTAGVVMFKWGNKGRRFRCQICDMSFMKSEDFKEHMSKHDKHRVGHNRFSCSICWKTFGSQNTLHLHNKIHSGIPTCRCKYCHKIFANKENLDKHIATHTNLLACGFCDEKFAYQSSLDLHSAVHNQTFPFKCEKCGKSFRRADILKRHSATHDSDKGKRFKCVECGKMYSQTFVLKRHMRSVHSNEHDGQTCEICGKFIRNKENVKRHMKIHRNSRDFECETCGRSFIQKQHLVDHMSTHSGTFDFKCKVCGRNFKHKRTLNRHIHTHNKKYPSQKFSCKHCDVKFPEEHLLTRHIKEEHGNLHMCTICRKSIDKAKLIRHLELHEKRGEHCLGRRAFRVLAHKSTSTEQLDSQSLESFTGSHGDDDGASIDVKSPEKSILVNHHGTIIYIVYDKDQVMDEDSNVDNASQTVFKSEEQLVQTIQETVSNVIESTAGKDSIHRDVSSPGLEDVSQNQNACTFTLGTDLNETQDLIGPTCTDGGEKETMANSSNHDDSIVITIPDHPDNEASRSMLFQSLIDYAERIIDQPHNS